MKKLNPMPDELSWPARRLLTLWRLTSTPYTLEPCITVGPYILDLAHPASMVGIDIARAQFHTTPTTRAKDQTRLTYLRNQGDTIVELTGENLLSRPYRCIARVEQTISEVLASD